MPARPGQRIELERTPVNPAGVPMGMDHPHRPDQPLTTVEFSVGGMHCAACVNRVEKAISTAPGVVQASVNLLEHRAQVRTGAGFDPDAVTEAVVGAGYEAELLLPAPGTGGAAHEASHDHAPPNLGRRVLIGVLLTIPVVAIGHGGLLVPALRDLDPGLRRTLDLLAGLLTLPIVGWVGVGFFTRAWKSFRIRQATMDTLVALGTGAAFLYSWAALLVPDAFPEGSGRPFFEAVAVVITLVLLGQLMEARAKGRTSRAIRALLDLAPERAVVVREGREVEVRADEIVVGDLVRVRPGERVPVDGTVHDGESAVDEALMTGESVPVPKAPGDPVTGGSVNTTGSLLFTAERVGQDTVLARVVSLVREAQGTKPPIQRVVDTIAHYFVPSVMVVAVVAFAAWYVVGPEPRLNYATVVAAAVLLISCPCALGLATPISVMIGLGKAAENGVLIRSGEALERGRNVDTVVFDKTGTLTLGEPRVHAVEPLIEGWSADRLLVVAAAVEAGSEHPLGQAVVAEARSRGVDVPRAEGFASRPGLGVEARVDGSTVRVGTAAYLGDAGLELEGAAEPVASLGKVGATPVLVAVEGQVVGVLGFRDTPRPEAAAVVARLVEDGVRVMMLTGDHEATARAVARDLGIEEVVARVLPDGKADVIRRLQAEGRTVALVGDGVNDAPALASADVGIAVGTGADVAVEAADVTLPGDSLLGVITTLDVSRATFRNIRQNLVGAFIYNVVGIPIAAGALYSALGLLLSPMIAGAAMAFSSVTVVTNANRLRGYRAPRLAR